MSQIFKMTYFLFLLAITQAMASNVSCDEEGCGALSDETALLQGLANTKSTIVGECRPNCGSAVPWAQKCRWKKACGGCANCSVSEDSACEGNCAKDAPFTCEEGFTFCDCASATPAKTPCTSITAEGPYDWKIITKTAMMWDKDTTCDNPRWVEIDLGKMTAFNTVELIRPIFETKDGKDSGWCGTRIEVDGDVIYKEMGYVNNKGRKEGNNVDLLAVTLDDGVWMGQKIKVWSSQSMKGKTVHINGIEVYKK